MSNAAQAAPTGPVILESKRDGIAVLVMNRPDKLNALNSQLSTALNEALARIAEDDSIHVVVLCGAGRAFCAGGDLGAIGKGRERNETAELGPILRSGMQAVLKMRLMPQPVVAAVNGPAAGAGMNIALAADIRMAADTASFGQNFSKVGLFPDYGGTYFLPQLVGPSVAAEMFYTGDMIDAQTALRRSGRSIGSGSEGSGAKNCARPAHRHSRREKGSIRKPRERTRKSPRSRS